MPTYPTATQCYEALPLVNMRPVGAIMELVNILQNSVNPAIAKINTELGLSGTQVIRTYDHFLKAPAVLTDKYLNALCIDWRLTHAPYGSQDRYSSLDISLIDVQGRISSQQQIENLWDRTGAVYGALYYARNGWPIPADTDGKVFWVQLIPTGIEPLREATNQYYGLVMRWRMVQGTGVNNWQ